MRVETYLPHPSSSGSLLPIHINLHGSGWCLPGFHQDDPFCDYIAKTVGCVVLNTDYSKAPELGWPAANNDVDAAIRWAHANAREMGWDPDRISIGGFSAGGNLALSASIGKEGRRLKAVAVFYCPYGARFFPLCVLKSKDFVHRTDLAQPAREKVAPKIPKGQSGVPLPGECARLL
jgi:acetyl esterase/lipase